MDVKLKNDNSQTGNLYNHSTDHISGRIVNTTGVNLTGSQIKNFNEIVFRGGVFTNTPAIELPKSANLLIDAWLKTTGLI